MKTLVYLYKERVGLVVICDRGIHCYMGRDSEVGMKKDWGGVGGIISLREMGVGVVGQLWKDKQQGWVWGCHLTWASICAGKLQLLPKKPKLLPLPRTLSPSFL